MVTSSPTNLALPPVINKRLLQGCDLLTDLRARLRGDGTQILRRQGGASLAQLFGKKNRFQHVPTISILLDD